MNIDPEEQAIIEAHRLRRAKFSEDLGLKDIARRIADAMTDETLSRFASLLDGDANNDFLEGINEVNMVRNPQDYGDSWPCPEGPP